MVSFAHPFTYLYLNLINPLPIKITHISNPITLDELLHRYKPSNFNNSRKSTTEVRPTGATQRSIRAAAAPVRILSGRLYAEEKERELSISSAPCTMANGSWIRITRIPAQSTSMRYQVWKMKRRQENPAASLEGGNPNFKSDNYHPFF